MSKEIRISDIPDNKTLDNYPEDTVFVWDDGDEWDDELYRAAMEELRKREE